MKKLIIKIVFVLLFLAPVSGFPANVNQGDKITIVTPDVNARLCPSPNCGSNQHITRIPQGTELVVEGIMTVKTGMMTTKWFEVTYKNKRGWVSMYDTNKQ